MSETAFHFGAPPDRPDACRVDVPRGARPAAVHAAYREALQLPDWVGANLDALFDVLVAQRPGPVVVVHGGLPKGDGDWVQRYLETLTDAAEHLAPGDLHLVFPSASRAAVSAALRG